MSDPIFAAIITASGAVVAAVVAALVKKRHSDAESGGASSDAKSDSDPNFSSAAKGSIQPEIVLSQIIQEQQKLNVRESHGEAVHECFTDDDLAEFIGKKRPEQIAETAKLDARFRGVISAFKLYSKTERERLLNYCIKPLRPTWEELGHITPEGQTVAGQEAEIMIAKCIVNFVIQEIDASND